MSLEIKELNIRVTVNQPQPESDPAGLAQSQSDKQDNEAVIQQCIERVIEIFNNKNER